MMKSKKSEILQKLDNNYYYCNINLPYNFIQEHGSVMGTLKSAIEYAINQHVKDVVRMVVEDIYTHEDFEKDISLEQS